VPLVLDGENNVQRHEQKHQQDRQHVEQEKHSKSNREDRVHLRFGSAFIDLIDSWVMVRIELLRLANNLCARRLITHIRFKTAAIAIDRLYFVACDSEFFDFAALNLFFQLDQIKVRTIRFYALTQKRSEQDARKNHDYKQSDVNDWPQRSQPQQ